MENPVIHKRNVSKLLRVVLLIRLRTTLLIKKAHSREDQVAQSLRAELHINQVMQRLMMDLS